jgi:hypothetical protein
MRQVVAAVDELGELQSEVVGRWLSVQEAGE